MTGVLLFCQVIQGRQRGTQRGGKVDVRITQFQGRDPVQRTSRQGASVLRLKLGLKFGPGIGKLAGIDRWFGRRNIQHDDPVQVIRLGEIGDVPLKTVDRGPSRLLFLAKLVAGDINNRLPHVEQRAILDIGIHLFQFIEALLDHAAVDGPAFVDQFEGFVGKVCLTDIVPTNDDIFPAHETKVGKLRQLAGEAHILGESFFERDQADDRRRGDASLGANQPNAGTRASH